MAGRFELFFSSLTGGNSWWSAITNALPGVADLLGALVDDGQANMIRDITAGLGTPDTARMLQNHRDIIDQLTLSQHKLLLVAHSQGNLFVNSAYHYALTHSSSDEVKVVHIAPASPTTSGPHTLADKDFVINGLRVVGSVPRITDVMPSYGDRPPGRNNERDILGHGLLEIYLNPYLPPFTRINHHILDALQSLDTYRRDPTTPYPPFPPFIPISFDEKTRPDPIYSRSPPSHRVDLISSTSSDAFYCDRVPKKQGYERPDFVCSPHSHGPEYPGFNPLFPNGGYIRRAMSGLNMEGSEECVYTVTDTGLYNRPIHSNGRWKVHLLKMRCTYQKFPNPVMSSLDWGSSRVNSKIEELISQESLPSGSVVRRVSLTKRPSEALSTAFGLLKGLDKDGKITSRWDRKIYFLDGIYEDEQYIKPQIMSGELVANGVYVRESNGLRSFSETYSGPEYSVENWPEIDRWNNALLRNRQLNEKRRREYDLLKEEYNKRQQSCSIASPPPITPIPTPEPDPSPLPTDPSDGGTPQPPGGDPISALPPPGGSDVP